MANTRVANWHWLCRNGFALVLVIVAGSGGGVVRAEEAVAKPGLALVDFARDIQPLLAMRCLRCHGVEKHEGGLRFDLRRTAMQGGDSGDTIVPGSSMKSRLIARVNGKGDDDRMPPDGEPLTEPQIQQLRAWIDQGTAWPEALAGKDTDAEHWSFQPIKRPMVPNMKSQISNLKSQISNRKFEIHNPIDAFILARLEREGITPAPEADRFTLLRRLSLDLTGLPPTPEEVQRFVEDTRPDAYAEVVDRLLASEHFGERWGRHWLDLARYADSDGYENDNLRPHAWQFRDWVVQSINRDQPFDQFTIEQLAGDLLPEAKTEQLVATGFHRNTLHNSAGGADKEEFRSKAVKDRADTTGIGAACIFSCRGRFSTRCSRPSMRRTATKPARAAIGPTLRFRLSHCSTIRRSWNARKRSASV